MANVQHFLSNILLADIFPGLRPEIGMTVASSLNYDHASRLNTGCIIFMIKAVQTKQHTS